MIYIIMYIGFGILYFVLFFDLIEEVINESEDSIDKEVRDYVIGLFYISCILGWPILVYSLVEDKIDMIRNKNK